MVHVKYILAKNTDGTGKGKRNSQTSPISAVCISASHCLHFEPIHRMFRTEDSSSRPPAWPLESNCPISNPPTAPH